MLRALALACLFFTRLPLKIEGPIAIEEIGRAAYCYPVVGLAIGAFGAALALAGQLLGLPAFAASITAVAAVILLTGALHEDGLADTADGLGVADRALRLAVMSDSRLGTFGAIALILSLLLRITLFAELISSEMGFTAFIVAHAVSRAMIVLPMHVLQPAKADGLGASAGKPPLWTVLLCLTFGLLISLAFLGPPGMPSFAVAALAVAAFTVWQRRSLGGYTGDTLGATQQISEISVLLSILLLVH